MELQSNGIGSKKVSTLKKDISISDAENTSNLNKNDNNMALSSKSIQYKNVANEEKNSSSNNDSTVVSSADESTKFNKDNNINLPRT